MKPTATLVEIPRGDTTLERRGWVYIARDAAGQALYIGHSVLPRERLRQHRNAAWWPQCADVEVLGPYDNAEAARDVEAALITEYQPANNVMHTDRWAVTHSRTLSPVATARREVERAEAALATARANLAFALDAEQASA